MHPIIDSNTGKLFAIAAVAGYFIHPGYVIAVGGIYKGLMVASEVMRLGGGDIPQIGEPESITNSAVDFAAIAAGAFAGKLIRQKTS